MDVQKGNLDFVTPIWHTVGSTFKIEAISELLIHHENINIHHLSS